MCSANTALLTLLAIALFFARPSVFLTAFIPASNARQKMPQRRKLYVAPAAFV
jgi:hypothetical protein